MKRGIIKMFPSLVKDYYLMSLIFSKFTCLKMDFDFEQGVNYFLMESELFEEVKEGNPIPEYEITIQLLANLEYEIIKVQKIEKPKFDQDKFFKAIIKANQW